MAYTSVSEEHSIFSLTPQGGGHFHSPKNQLKPVSFCLKTTNVKKMAKIFLALLAPGHFSGLLLTLQGEGSTQQTSHSF